MRSISLVLAILLGIFVPQAAQLSFLIQWLLAGMLFFSFLNLKVSVKLISFQHLKIAFGSIIFGTTLYFLLKPFNENLALATSIIALAPTAIAAPVMAKLLKANVVWVALSTLTTNLLIALLLPFYVSLIYGIQSQVSIWILLKSLTIIFFIPYFLALLVQNYFTGILSALNKLGNVSFILFVSNIFLASAKSSHFIQFETNESMPIIILISIFSALVCLISFGFGSFLGRKKNSVEHSLAFGQKNTLFSVWIAITYINPLVSLAPMSYVLFQNMYLSFLLYKSKKNENP